MRFKSFGLSIVHLCLSLILVSILFVSFIIFIAVLDHWQGDNEG